MISYPWTCHLCQASNAPGLDRCAVCDFPAIASAQDIAQASYAADGQRSEANRRPFEARATAYSAANAVWLAGISRLAYESVENMRAAANRWKLEATIPAESVMNQQALLLQDDEKVIVTFRGTQPNRVKGIFWDVFIADLSGHLEFAWTGQDLRPTTYQNRSDKMRGVSLYKFHSGFKTAWEMLANFYELPSLITEAAAGGKPIWLTGHSLGGAIALLAATHLLTQDLDVQGVYLFGAPRVGNGEFARDYDLRMGERTFRFVNHADIVPRVPLFSSGYAHVGQLLYFDSAGSIDFHSSAAYAVADFWLRRMWRNLPLVFTFKAHSMDRYVALVERATPL